MTDPASLAVASCALSVAAALAWLSLPAPPQLDAQRWFKVMLATLLRGEVERAGGEVDAWVAQVVRAAPFHPLARRPERWVTGRVAEEVSAQAAASLVDRLAAAPTLAERWRALFDEDEAALEARLDDPHELGAAYDPRTWLGTVGWDELAAWRPDQPGPFVEALRRRLDATWVLVGDGDAPGAALLGALAAQAGRSVQVDPVDGAALLAAIEPHAAGTGGFVLVGAGAGMQRVLQALVDSEGLRDRTVAVVSLGARLTGTPTLDDWMAARFRHHDLDTEVDRLTPYFAFQWLDREADPPGAFGIPIQDARFPEPGLDAMTRDAVQPVDLGVLPRDGDPALVARALLALVGCWVASQRQ